MKEYSQVIISCGASKIETKPGEYVRAVNLYQGGYYKAMLNLALKTGHEVYILSAGYGLLALNDMVQTYDIKMSPKIAKWMKANGIVQFNGGSLLGKVYASAVIGELEDIIPSMRMGYKIQAAKQKAEGLLDLNPQALNQAPGNYREIITPEELWK